MVDALREFCEMHNLLPRGVRLAPDDIWDRIAYILSVKMSDPQFSGQTKERLSSRACATFVSGVVKDSFSLWLNQNVTDGEAIATLAITNAQKRMKKSRQVVRKKITSGPALPGKLADCSQPGPSPDRIVPGRRRLSRWFCQTGPQSRIPGHFAVARQDPEHLGSRIRRGAVQPGSPRYLGCHRR